MNVVQLNPHRPCTLVRRCHCRPLPPAQKYQQGPAITQRASHRLITDANTSGAHPGLLPPQRAPSPAETRAQSRSLTRRDARSMSTRLFAGESFAIFADCSRFFRALQTPLIIAVLAPRVRSGLQPRSIVRDDDEDDGGDDEAQRSLGQCMAEEWAETAEGRDEGGP